MKGGAKCRRVKRATRLVLLLALLAAGATLAYAGAQPQAYLAVGDVAGNPSAYAAREVELKGTVIEGSLARDAEPLRFLMGDGGSALEVRWDPARPIPETGGTIEGKSVVIRGQVVTDAGGTYLLADSMQVGCASKYQADEG